MADVGQEEDFEAAKAKALKIGAKKFFLEDLKREFVEELIYRESLIASRRRMLGVDIARADNRFDVLLVLFSFLLLFICIRIPAFHYSRHLSCRSMQRHLRGSLPFGNFAC